MTRLDEIIANALAGIPETDVVILAREVARLRGKRVAVAPEMTGEILEGIASFDDYAAQIINMDATAESVTEWFRKNSRSIPADCVLGEGERRICSEELMYLRSLERYARKHGHKSIQDVIGCLDHLRANQGGAAT